MQKRENAISFGLPQSDVMILIWKWQQLTQVSVSSPVLSLESVCGPTSPNSSVKAAIMSESLICVSRLSVDDGVGA